MPTKNFTIKTAATHTLTVHIPPAGTGHTVFAQVFDGMDVVRSIMGVETDSNDKPLEDVTILSAEIVPYE